MITKLLNQLKCRHIIIHTHMMSHVCKLFNSKCIFSQLLYTIKSCVLNPLYDLLIDKKQEPENDSYGLRAFLFIGKWAARSSSLDNV